MFRRSVSRRSGVVPTPRLMTIRSGLRVPFPEGHARNFNPSNVYMYGDEALRHFFDESLPEADASNQAKQHYVSLRKSLLDRFEGLWLAATADGSTFALGQTALDAQRSAGSKRNAAEVYTNCLGRECIEFGYLLQNESSHEPTLSAKEPCVITNNRPFVFVEGGSIGGEQLPPMTMLLDTGAVNCVGPAPASSLGHTNVWWREYHYQVADGRTYRTKTTDAVIRLQEHEVECEWARSTSGSYILGFDVTKQFRMVVDSSASPPIQFTAREQHSPSPT